LLKIKRPDNLSDNAWLILQAVFNHHVKTESLYFKDFSQFNFSKEDLYKYCQELHDAHLVFFEGVGTPLMDLYVLPNFFYNIHS